MSNAKALIPLGFLLALGLVISTYLVTNVARDLLMARQIIKVRGYAEIPVESDLAIWHITVKANDRNMAKAYPILAAHRKKVIAFLKENGVKPEEIKIISVQVREHKKRTENGYETSEIAAFQLSQDITVKSKDVHNISKISTAISDLLGEGVALKTEMPSYYYTRVNELKSTLLVEATTDARLRAKTLAEGSDVNLGPLRAARQGIFSVRSADASSIAEKAADDVASIPKKITAVVTVDYAMR